MVKRLIAGSAEASGATGPAQIVQYPSVAALSLVTLRGELEIARATGFLVQGNTRTLVVTNRHVVTGIHQSTRMVLHPSGAVPSHIAIVHRSPKGFHKAFRIQQALVDSEEERLWFEHPVLGSVADIVALPIVESNHIKTFPFNIAEVDSGLTVGPGDPISVVGYPFGRDANGLAIWATGFVASEPALDYGRKPVFLIDSRTRPGQSGSAVIAARAPGTVVWKDGHFVSFDSPMYKFLGVYSGRMNDESDLGFVWKASALRDLIDSVP